ncbi:STAS domain-containing protein [Herpetosiphon sp.]|uniref:Anti-sigma-factor antagonist n=1 Tax=Herpetosiphon aurantiacus (strain ATCC 23779 / DSM 785 / 114-95) TaxID=316274 RepID=A9AY75_HERA2|nr:STAS domain-containing protein [Herpetosiphon sp.]ABX06957.1 anti-sigma-factor antagonist [Herpetosiphon aurantiacus DSM 785]
MAELDNDRLQQQRFARIVRGSLIFLLAFICYDIGLQILAPKPARYLHLVNLIGLLGFLTASYLVNQRGRTPQAMLLVATAMLGSSLMMALSNPFALPVILMMPILALILAMLYLEQKMARVLSVVAWLCMLLATILAYNVNLFNQAVMPSMEISDFVGLAVLAGIAFLVLNLFQSRLRNNFLKATQAQKELLQAQSVMEQQIIERTSTLSQLQQTNAEQTRLLAEVEHQRLIIRNLSVPILPIDQRTLVLPLVGSLDQQRLDDVRNQALQTISQFKARYLVLDITGVPLIDDQIALSLVRIIEALKLLGAKTILVGVRPDVAASLASGNLQLGSVTSAATLQEGLDYARTQSKALAKIA